MAPNRYIINRLIIFGTGFSLGLFSLIYFSIIGYPLVETFTGRLNLSTTPIYMVPIFVVYGFILGELFVSFKEEKDEYYGKILLVELLVIGFLSFLRITPFVSFIPFSGHSLILSYFLLTQIVTYKKKQLFQIVIGMLVLIITVYYKFMVWNDPITFLNGALIGGGVFVIGYYFKQKIKSELILT